MINKNYNNNAVDSSSMNNTNTVSKEVQQSRPGRQQTRSTLRSRSPSDIVISQTPEKERSLADDDDGTDSQLSGAAAAAKQHNEKKHRSLIVERKRKMSSLHGNSGTAADQQMQH